MDANLDINKQTQQAEDFMTKGVDVLIMTPVNEEGVVPILRKAKADGTPVVLEGNPAKGMTTLFAICDYDAGFKAGDAVGRILVSRGESEARVMDVGLPLLSATVLRSLGFSSDEDIYNAFDLILDLNPAKIDVEKLSHYVVI